MRILAFAALLLTVADPARADDAFITKTQIYVDSDHTTVISPLVKIHKNLWQGATLGAGFVADVVSSASVDVITNATTHMSDFRKEASATFSQVLSDTTLSAAYLYSTENDYSSHNLHLGIAQDLFKKNTTLALNYSLGLNDVGRSGDPNFHNSLDTHSIDASLTQVLAPKTIMSLGYEFQYSSGYQASPYRFVHIETDPDFKVPETDPDTRRRSAFVLALNQHIGEDSAIQADYRLYIDDWGITAHTVQLRYLANFGNLTLRLRERIYYQSAAFFYQPHYAALQAYVTADRELSDFWSSLTGIKLTYRLKQVLSGLELEAKVDFFYFDYLSFAYLQNRIGADIEAGVTLLY